MKLFTSLCCLLVLTLTALSAVPADASAAPPTESAMRARRMAARQYAGMAVSLPVSAFSNGLHVCAKETPSGINGFWKVSPKVVDLLDAELLRHLRKSGLDKRLPFSAKLYVRQYAGFVRDGARFVYVNALLLEKGSPLVNEAQKGFLRTCDTVSGFWGIQYDTQSKQFLGFTGR